MKALLIGGTGTISSAITHLVAGDKAHTVIFDNSKVKRAVPGFCATTRFDQGAKLSIDYMMSHPELQLEEPEFDEWCDRVIVAMENAKQSLM